MTTVHVSIPPVKTYVAKKFLYDMDEAYEGQWERCKIFAVSSYKSVALTFKAVICSNGGVFDYLPPHAFSQTKTTPEFDLGDLCYQPCPSWNITVTVHDELKTYPCWVWIKRLAMFTKGHYHCSVDWYDENESVNIIQLKNGQITAAPNHKSLFAKEMPQFLPDYKPVRSIWRV